MNIISEIRALFALRGVATDVVKEATTMNGVKPGWKTTEFWVKVITVDMPLLWGVVHSFIPANLALEIELGATAVYTAGRVIVKAVNDIKAARAGTPVVTKAAA